MLSIFPNLFNYAIIVSLLLRVFLAYFAIKESVLIFKQTRTNLVVKYAKAILFFAGGILLAIGLFTQPASLALLVLVLFKKDINLDFRILLIIVCIALLFLGPGPLSIDLPL